MHKFEIEVKLHKILKKLSKKNKKTYGIIFKKIKEIVSSPDINHYKNLRSPMNKFKRIHIDKSFVLIFKYNDAKDLITFYDFDHHDSIYK